MNSATIERGDCGLILQVEYTTLGLCRLPEISCRHHFRVSIDISWTVLTIKMNFAGADKSFIESGRHKKV